MSRSVCCRSLALLVFLTAAGLARNAVAQSDVCYQGGPTLANFKLNGDAKLTATSMVITESAFNLAGSAMYQNKFQSSSDFHIKMKVRIGAGTFIPADGMAFVMHNDAAGTSALGTAGGGVGYDGIQNSVVVEFDTYQNVNDPIGPHIAINKVWADHGHVNNAGLPAPIEFGSLPGGFDPTDGTPFFIWIDYNATTDSLQVFVSQADSKPVAAALTATLDLTAELGADFYVGFVGSTGGFWNLHEFQELYVTDHAATATASCCASDADCVASPFGAVCDTVKRVCGACTFSNVAGCAMGQGCGLASSHNACVAACDGNQGGGSPNACVSTAFAACRMSGVGAGSCAACNGDFGAAVAVACGAGAPYCASSGYCGLCTSNADCTVVGATHTGAFCNTTIGSCVSACAVDGDCGPGNACLAGACVAQAANSGAIPGGSCTGPLGGRYCASAVCSASNNTCGYVNGLGPCSAMTAGTVCQSGACSTANVCIPAASGSCFVDGECMASQYCDRSTFMCRAKLAAGQPIPNDGLHGGVCTPSAASAVCVSAACNQSANTCALANGGACTSAPMCVINLCGSNGLCGLANGSPGCSAVNASTLCQSGTCSPSGTCIPAAGCNVDAECGGGTFCNRATLTCTAKLAPGVTIPNDGLHGGTCTPAVGAAVCSTGLCNATSNSCASALGASCAVAADCQNNVCGGDGKCGRTSGAGPCTAMNASSICQSGICSLGLVCIPAGAGRCWVDADCNSTQYCDRANMTCTAKLGNGAAIPSDTLHLGTCASAGAVCQSGMCNTTSVTCAGPLGSPCTTADQCAIAICGSNGLCGLASGTGPCTAGTAATVCQSGICSATGGLCQPASSGGCAVDADCGAGQFCDPVVLGCAARKQAGAALPMDRLHDGVCSTALAAAVCADGACNALTNTCAQAAGAPCSAAAECAGNVCMAGFCGLPRGTGPCTAGNASMVCASGRCSPGGTCLGGNAAGCWVDSDCAADSYCDRAADTCRPRLAAGMPIPLDGLHDGRCPAPGASPVCQSGVCNATANTCAGAVGATCAAAAECAGNVCGSNGKCGQLDGTGTCTAGTAAAVCQSGVCGTRSGRCIPADAGGCGSDGDCPSGQFCNDITDHCTDKLGPGMSLPAGAHQSCTDGMKLACASGLCNVTTGTCAGPLGTDCTAGNQCPADICGSNGKCGLADGQMGCTLATGNLCQSGTCGANMVCGSQGCVRDADCPATAYCDETMHLCRAKLIAGTALPRDGLHDGTCTPAAAAAVCATGVCNTANNRCAQVSGQACAADTDCGVGICGSNGKCGLADGQAGCTAATASLCQSLRCSPVTGRCLPLGVDRCGTDADCVFGQFCDAATLTCVARLAGGAPLPMDAIHDGKCLPGLAAAVCASGLCNAQRGTCAWPAGVSCTSGAECAGDRCAANGRCGAPDGEGPCDAGNAAVVCQSGTCSGTGGVCRPGGENRCAIDGDCGAGSFCAGSNRTCAPKLMAGAALPRDGLHAGTCDAALAASVCETGACNPVANTCALANDVTCRIAAECASNQCDGGLCGLTLGGRCTSDAECRRGTCSDGRCGGLRLSGGGCAVATADSGDGGLVLLLLVLGAGVGLRLRRRRR